MLYIMPGDPITHMVDPNVSPERIAELRVQYGFDRPLIEQYGKWLKRVVVDHDFGTSYKNKLPVWDLIRARIPVSLRLTATTLVLQLLIADITWCIPGMILTPAVVTLLGKGLTNSIIAISLVNWAQYARTVRAKTMSIKKMAFIETGIAFGEKPLSLMFRYIFPNVVPALIIMVSTQLPGTIVSTTALSFLGLGYPPRPTGAWRWYTPCSVRL